MKDFRTLLASIVILALASGYALSQRAFFQGTFAEYAERVDVPSIAYLATALLAALIAAAFWSEKGTGDP